MGSSGGSSSGDNTVRYAEYFENAHKAILNHNGADTPTTSVVSAFNAALGASPYTSTAYTFDLEGGFFGEGYDISSFPTLWDMFGKFMAGVDVHDMWQQTFYGISTSNEINTAINAQAALLDDDIETNIYPRFEAGMRDINAVQSSAFAVGRAIIEDGRVKAINKFGSEIRLRALDISADMWKAHLRWNEAVINSYSQMFKLFYATKIDVNAQNVDIAVRDSLWDLSLYEYVRAMLGVISGAQGTVPEKELSTTQKALSGALGGASMGASVGGGVGAVVGGALGLATAFL